ncbi:hypothetical protein C672_2005 [[Clostridium] bifermentans ATCC 638]|uniref:Uncharacterized protein n=1 Tax=Paraclostridium bifermentans ATCC 638 = DSM 14991 TaxID=1233171 RepID=T4VQM6_PARBF|nr:hypothetical protein [Paraclostridium bifermentans]EQK43061.1 hypothetical protein C672_2005 [[Clostridium] bifermentans ATCC 638] [Paraclostridium bifermentans ATCC 638 = DSM 14991]RIZ60293.1 hypothetical protein CHH45_00565 [Paraclostridium bifermentans]UAG16935.1 hypothetical protein KXZ80_09050 [Paraclostridium bifermentans]
MYLNKLSILTTIILFVFISNINASYSIERYPSDSSLASISKDLDFLDSNMYVLVKSISTENFDTSGARNQISFINSLIYDLTEQSYNLSKDQADVVAALQAILGFYKLSIIEANKYIDSKDSDDLISSINAFSMGYTSSINLRNIVFRQAN